MVAVLPELAVDSTGPDRWQVSFPSRWGVGRNQNGGVVMAAATAALGAAVGQPHPLTATAHFLRPTGTGAATVRTSVIRRGRTASTGAAEVWQDGKERLGVTAMFADLDDHSRDTPPAPTVEAVAGPIPSPDACTDLFDLLSASPAGTRALTRSLRNFAIRVDPGDGWGPGSDGHPSLSGWIRLLDEETVSPQMLPAIADGFPPTVMSSVSVGWLPTLELTVHVLAAPAPDEPWLRAELRTRTVSSGLIDEDGELWDATGRLVARFRQLAVLLPPDATGRHPA